MKKVLKVLFIFVLALTTLMTTTIGQTTANASRRAYDNLSTEITPLDIGPRLRYLESNDEERAKIDVQVNDKLNTLLNGNTPSTATTANSAFTFDGGTKVFLAYDIVNGYYPKRFTLRSIGDNVEVWVANDLSYADDRPDDVVTQTQVDMVRDEFNSNIYPKNTQFFGNENSHTGVNSLFVQQGQLPVGYYEPEDGVERTIILVDNVRDENYYNGSYPFIIAGFYTPSFERYFDRNVISIDSSYWATRLNGKFGTIAHEFQHLIHDDNDSDEESWINEGMSDFSEYLCGYGHPMGHVNFFLSHPENSLVDWDEHLNAVTGPETLADYGQAYLFQLYLYDHYGKEFIRTLAKDKKNGIESVDALLKSTPSPVYNELNDFDEIFRRFTIALAVDDRRIIHTGRNYYFKSIDLKVDLESAKTFDKDGVPAWGADYKKIDISKPIESIELNGSEFLYPYKVQPSPTDATNYVYYAGKSDLLNNLGIIKVDLTSTDNATLTFDHYFDIESNWDFGFVQVSEDGGNTWKSLETDSMTDVIDPQGHPDIIANLPGYTGSSNGWATETIDLSAYAGKNILVGFRYMTDWGTTNEGWYIDNIRIDEANISLDGSSQEDLISMFILQDIPVKFAMSFVKYDKNMPWPYPGEVPPASLTYFSAKRFKNGILNYYPNDTLTGDEVYMIVWYAAPKGVKSYANFSYKINYK